MESPNLITASGRESMPLDDRIALLAADVTALEAGIMNPNWSPRLGIPFGEWDRNDGGHGDGLGSRAHAFNQMLGKLRSYVHMHSKQIGINPRRLSLDECELLAWRRGGFNEWHAVCREVESRDRARRAGAR